MKSVKKAVKKAAAARKKAAAKKAGRGARKTAAPRPKVAAVAAARGAAKVAPSSAFREEYTIAARNFGPIAEAKLTLKPLTVLIGPSNTGKTYMATLAYMIVNEHAQFVRGARQAMFLTPYESALKKMSEGALREIAAGMINAIEAGGRSVSLSELPDKFRNPWRKIADEMFAEATRGDVEIGIEQYFGVGAGDAGVAALIGAADDSFLCECVARADGAESARVQIRRDRKGEASVAGKLTNFHLPILSSEMSGDVKRTKDVLSGAPGVFRQKGAAAIEKIIDRMFRGDARGAAANPSAHFLPASREGLTRAQQIMRLGTMRLASQAGWPDVSTASLSRVVGDYMAEVDVLLSRLSGLRERSDIVRRLGISGVSDLANFRVRLRKTAPEITTAVKKTEELLGGEIVAKRFGKNGRSSLAPPPALAYRPKGLKSPDGRAVELTMAQSSSMVGELAPLVLYLKGGIEPGDTLFIEEPEAHLHPAAQTEMAEILAALVRAGIRVVITTHSDWLLDAVAHLVRQGETNSGDEFALKKDEVGVYWFGPGKAGQGSAAVLQRFDNDNGYLPRDVRAESTALYNKTVPLQAKLDEMRAK